METRSGFMGIPLTIIGRVKNEDKYTKSIFKKFGKQSKSDFSGGKKQSDTGADRSNQRIVSKKRADQSSRIEKLL